MTKSTVTILLFAPRPAACGLGALLEGEGWRVVLATSARGFAQLMKAEPVDLVILDDPPWELARFALSALEAAEDLVPRVWLSSLPEAPGHSGKLGVDALFLAPVDPRRVIDRARALLLPRAPSSSGSHRFFPLGSNPELEAVMPMPMPVPPPVTSAGPSARETTVGLAPRRGRPRSDGGWDEESTGNWP